MQLVCFRPRYLLNRLRTNSKLISFVIYLSYNKFKLLKRFWSFFVKKISTKIFMFLIQRISETSQCLYILIFAFIVPPKVSIAKYRLCPIPNECTEPSVFVSLPVTQTIVQKLHVIILHNSERSYK